MSVSIYSEIENELRRAYTETGVRPSVVFVSLRTLSSLRHEMITGSRHSERPTLGYGFEQMVYMSTLGPVDIVPSKEVPDDVFWAGTGSYNDYWARRILLGDTSVDFTDR